MTNRTYRALLGLTLLVTLYFELDKLMYGLIALLFLEGVSNIFLSNVVCLMRNCVSKKDPVFIDSEFAENPRFNIYSERVWRLVVGIFLLIGYSFYSVLWFLPWFMGFAIFGAGLSGLCPVLLAICWIGFK